MLQYHVGEGMHLKFATFLGIEAPSEELPAGRRCGGRGGGSGEYFFISNLLEIYYYGNWKGDGGFFCT